MITTEYCEEYVYPIYEYLMMGARLDHATDEKNHFILNLNKTLQQITDDEIKALLHDDNWRCSLVGAWMAFLTNDIRLLDDIGDCLLKPKAGDVGYCYTLAKFGTEKCSVYLSQYLERELSFTKSPNEKRQYNALYALMYIDKQNHTNFSDTILQPNGLWQRFVEYEFKLHASSFQLKDSPTWGDIDAGYEKFVKQFDFMNDLSVK